MKQLVAMLQNKTGKSFGVGAGGKQSSFSGMESSPNSNNARHTTIPTDESPKRKMKRIITIQEGEDTTDDNEDKKQHFEFESPTKPDGDEEIDDYADDNGDGRLKTETDVFNAQSIRDSLKKELDDRGTKTHMGFKDIENHILKNVER